MRVYFISSFYVLLRISSSVRYMSSTRGAQKFSVEYLYKVIQALVMSLSLWSRWCLRLETLPFPKTFAWTWLLFHKIQFFSTRYSSCYHRRHDNTHSSFQPASDAFLLFITELTSFELQLPIDERGGSIFVGLVFLPGWPRCVRIRLVYANVLVTGAHRRKISILPCSNF